MGRFDQKVVVVSAGGQAIGAGIAQRFVQEGARVLLLDSNAEAGKAVAKSIGATFVPADLQNKASVTAAVESVGKQHGHIDVIVLGGEDLSAAEQWKPFEDKSDADFEGLINRVIWSTIWTLRAALPYMRDSGASLIFVFSPFGQYASRNISDEMLSRWGVLGLARSIANEWGRYQIRANILVPLADTPAYRTYRARGPELVDWRVSKTPMRRAGDPVKDIGGAALFLASDDTRYVTAQVVYADGGAFLTTPVVEAVWDQ